MRNDDGISHHGNGHRDTFGAFAVEIVCVNVIHTQTFTLQRHINIEELAEFFASRTDLCIDAANKFIQRNSRLQ